MYLMVKITKSEKQEILKRYPDMTFVRTMIADSKRHHYYMVEKPGPMALLQKLRGFEPDKKQSNKRRGYNRNKKGAAND